jgi:hypothetical protein
MQSHVCNPTTSSGFLIGQNFVSVFGDMILVSTLVTHRATMNMITDNTFAHIPDTGQFQMPQMSEMRLSRQPCHPLENR